MQCLLVPPAPDVVDHPCAKAGPPRSLDEALEDISPPPLMGMGSAEGDMEELEVHRDPFKVSELQELSSVGSALLVQPAPEGPAERQAS